MVGLKPIKKWTSIDFRNARKNAIEALAGSKDGLRIIIEPIFTKKWKNNRAKLIKEAITMEKTRQYHERKSESDLIALVDRNISPPEFYKAKVMARVYNVNKKSYSNVRYKSGIISNQQFKAFIKLGGFSFRKWVGKVLEYSPYDQLQIQMNGEAALALDKAHGRRYNSVFQDYLNKGYIKMILYNTKTGIETKIRKPIDLSKKQPPQEVRKRAVV